MIVIVSAKLQSNPKRGNGYFFECLQKVGVLTEFLDRYRMLQMLFRVCVEQKVITERKYASFGLLLEKIGKQATSWKQYNERGMKKQEDKRQ